MKFLLGIAVLLISAGALAAPAPFSGTFDGYRVVGVGVPLTGVTDDVSTWPLLDADDIEDGLQPFSFDIAGVINIENGTVIGAVINQTSTWTIDIAGAAGTDRQTVTGVSWGYTGGDTLPFQVGSGAGVSGTCNEAGTMNPPLGTGCDEQIADLQAESADSRWYWGGVPANFLVSDLFGGSNIFNLDVGGDDGIPGVDWNVDGLAVTAAVSQALPGSTGTFNSAYYGVFNIQVVPVPAAVWLFGSALGLLGWIRRRQTA